jgi:hypothetical protein
LALSIFPSFLSSLLLLLLGTVALLSSPFIVYLWS